MHIENDLTQEEYTILSCNKENWDKKEKRYMQFMKTLKKYIASWGTALSIDFNDIAFPEIIIDKDILGNRGMHLMNCTFYGEVTFENIVFEGLVRIQDCVFEGIATFQDIVFQEDTTIACNHHHGVSIFKDIIFHNELYFSNIEFTKRAFYENLHFYKDADFNDILLKDGCKILELKGLEFFKWDALFCVYYTPHCFWDAREEYMENYLQDNINDKQKIELTQEIKNLFPDVAEEVNKRLIESSDDWSCYFFLEFFVDVTSRHLQRREYTQATAHLEYIEKKMKYGDDELESLLDVAYIENLLWELKPHEKKRVWEYLPTGIQNRYARIWGSLG